MELFVSAPRLNYRRGILLAEHDFPGAYPVSIASWYLALRVPNRSVDEMSTRYCKNQDEFFDAVKQVLQSPRLTGHIESLIAQINDAEAVAPSA